MRVENRAKMTNLIDCRLVGGRHLFGMMRLLPAILIILGQAALASDGGSAASRAELFERQKRLLDGRAATQYSGSKRLQPDSAETVVTKLRYSGAYKGVYLGEARQAARRHGVPEDLFLRLVQQESGWDPNAVSEKGAIGLAQLMPGTARSLRVDPRDPSENLDGGARYLAKQYRTFRDWRLALAAYNAGPGAVKKYNGVPPFDETQGYVRAILGR